MKKKVVHILFGLFIAFGACSQTIDPGSPDLSPGGYKLDLLPVSEINIPIQVNLKPLYAMAEKNVDTVFTSPQYPDGWVQEECDMRYKYIFRRSPLQIKGYGNSFYMGFTGYYKITGSSRLCVKGTVLSPWTPPCRCGFDEPERRVNVSFYNTINLLPDFKIKLAIKRNEPEPLDKCEVCFWGQDITKQVMKGLVAELDTAQKAMIKNYETVDLRPRFQKIWEQLDTAYNLYGLGWLQINPQKIHINNLFVDKDSLNVYLGLVAKPVISFEKPPAKKSTLPNIGMSGRQQGFSIYLDAVLNYDSLSHILNQQAAGKQFDFKKGFIKKKFIIDECKIQEGGFEKLVIKINFSGTNNGVIYLTGKPVYDQEKRTIEVTEMDFDIKSKNMLLASANWLFNKKITNEINKYARFDLAPFIDSAKTMINKQLNREWIKGINSYGDITDITLSGIYPMSRYLVVRSNCTGDLSIKVADVNFSL